MEIKTNIVVSRYNKNVDFVYKINNNKNINIMIYDKENDNNLLNIPFNKGNEASVYLKYIIDNYDNLTDMSRQDDREVGLQVQTPFIQIMNVIIVNKS